MATEDKDVLQAILDKNSELDQLMDNVRAVLDEAHTYGLDVEVVTWALMFARKHPEVPLDTCLDWALDEWVK